MKNILKLFIGILFTAQMNGQIIQDLALNTSFTYKAYSMVRVGNIIYYTNTNPNNSNQVYKFDHTLANPVSTPANIGTSGFSFLAGIVYHNNFLYVAANNAIWKIDLSIPNPEPQIYFYDGITSASRTLNVFSLCVIGNELYFNKTSSTSPRNSSIYKIDLTQSTPNPTLVISNLNHSIGSLLNVGNTMYVSTLGSGNGLAVRKFSLSNPGAGITDVINESGYFGRMVYYKNKIFYPNETNGTVKSFDPLETSPTPSLEFNIPLVAGLLDVDCDLYVGTTTTGMTNRIAKVRYPFITGNSIQTINVTNPSEATIEDLVVNGTNITWFNSSSDALANINPIAPNTQLVQGNTYYAMSTDGVCSSLPFAVSVSVLGTDEFLKNKLKVYPNPTNDNVFIDFEEICSKASIEVVNCMGQKIQTSNFENVTNINFKMPVISGVYFVKVTTDKGSVSYKIIKQ